MKKTQIVGAILSIAVLIGMFFVPESIGLSKEGICTLGLLIAVIIALVTEPLPIGVTCMIGVALMVLLHVYPTVGEALCGYTNHILFFVLVSFGISQAIAKVPLSKRLLVALVHIFGAKSERVLLAVMLCAAIMSSVMSNVATTAVLVTVILDFLKVYESEEDKKHSAKAFMIGLPIASMLGGMITPAGSPLNILGMDYLADAGIRISFIEWMAIGAPVAIVMILISWFLVVKVFKPAKIDEYKTLEYLDSLDIPKKFDIHETYVAIITCCMFVLWVASSWFPQISITVVGTIGFGFLFLPKIGVLDWKEYSTSVSWASYFLIGTMMSLGAALTVNGVSDWLVKLLFSGQMNFSLPIMVLIVSVVVFLLLIPIPIGPALISMLGGPFITLAMQWNVSPVVLIMTLVLCAANCFLLPLDTVPLLTYSTGTYKMTDMPKVSAPIQAILSICLAIWLPIVLNFLGYL